MRRIGKRVVEFDGEKSGPVLGLVLHTAVPDMDMVKALVEDCAVNIHGEFHIHGKWWTQTYLHYLAHGTQFWHLDVMGYLIGRGADVNALNSRGQTALHTAAHAYSALTLPGNASMFVRKLLDLGADPNIPDKEGHTALSRANSADVIRAIQSTSTGVVDEKSTLSLFRHVWERMSGWNEEEDGDELLAIIREVVVDHKDILHVDFENVPYETLTCKTRQDPLRDTVVHKLFRSGLRFPEAVDMMFEFHPERLDFNRRNPSGQTVLMAACEVENDRRWDISPYLRLLDERYGVDKLAVDNEGNNILV
jgi:hypothetical protein